jgi:hypothetical protein
MRGPTSGKKERVGVKIGVSLLLVIASGLLAVTLRAQQKGPLPPPARTDTAAATPAAMPKANTAPQDRSSHLTNEPPSVPVEQIIKKFTENEAEFRKEREKYTYTQVFLFQTIDDDGQPDGEFR